jgi:hypothetical protein
MNQFFPMFLLEELLGMSDIHPFTRGWPGSLIRLGLRRATSEQNGNQKGYEGVRRAVDSVPLLVEERLFRAALTR